MAFGWFYLQQLDRIEQKIDTLLKQQRTYAMAIKDDVDNLVKEVEDNTNVVNSVQTLLTRLTDMLKAIPPSTDPATQAALQQAITTLDRNNKAIAEAVVANTPAE